MKLNEVLSVIGSERGFIIVKLERENLNLETLQMIPPGMEKIKQFSNINGIILYLENLKGPSFHDFNLYTQKEGLLSSYMDAGKNCLLSFESFNIPFGIYVENYASDMAVEFLLRAERLFCSPDAYINWRYFEIPIFPLFGTLSDFLNLWGIENSLKFFLDGKSFSIKDAFGGFEIPKDFLLEGFEKYFKDKDLNKESKNILWKKIRDYIYWKRKKRNLNLEISELSRELINLYLKDKLTKEEEEIYIRNYLLRERVQSRLKYLVMKEGLESSEVPEDIKIEESCIFLGFSSEGKEIYKRCLERDFKVRVLESNVDIFKNNFFPVPENKKLSISPYYYGMKRYPVILENISIKEEEKGEFIISLSEKYDIEGVLLVSLKTTNLKTIEKKYNHPTRILGYNIPPSLPKRDFVEIVKGARTSQESIKIASRFFYHLGYFPIIVSDKTGFLTYRIVSQILNEAFFLLEEGYPPSIIEEAFRIDGFQKGPLQLGDEIGFSILSSIAQINYLSLKGLPEVNRIFSVLAELERFEKRFPIKFFIYKNKKIFKENKKLLKHLGLKFKKDEIGEEEREEIYERFLITLLNASFNCIDSGVVDWLDKIDIAMSFMIGNASSNLPFIKHCDNLGWQHILSICNRLVSKFGERYSPSKGICELSSIT